MARSRRAPETGVDWDDVRNSLRRQFGSRLGSGERAHLEDLVQEACVRLLRALRRETVRDLKALEHTIVQRTWVDHVRRQARRRRFFAPAGETTVIGTAVSPEENVWEGNEEERLRFVVFSVFEQEGATGCAELARAYFREMDWKRVGEVLSIPHATVRKRWSRCVDTARRAVEADPTWAWILGRVPPSGSLG